MRTVTFRSVLHGVATRLGLEPTANLERPQAQALAEYIQNKLEESWELIPWPEWTYAEERQFRNDYNAATSYVVGNEVYYETENKYYICILNSLGNLPTDTTYWEEATELDRYIARDQSWETRDIGMVWEVYQDDPKEFSRPRKVEWWISTNGIQITTSALAKVWVWFGTHPPQFTANEWSSSTTYAIGDVVYYPSTGQCYMAVQAGSDHLPTLSTYWELQRFPYILAKHVKEAAYARALTEDEAFDKASIQEAIAEMSLSKAMDAESGAMRSRTFTSKAA
jgi:hypothetical protein